MKNKLKVFSTFTGIGSPEMSLRNIGIDFEVVGTSEVDKWALLAYDAIHNNQDIIIDVPKESDIRKEIKDKNICYNFSTKKQEIPKQLSELQRVFVAHKRSKNYGDIRLINEKELPDFDLFTYSFPCKDISITGKRKGFGENSDTSSSLLWECKKIISYKLPKYLLMENVKNLVGIAFIKYFEKWEKELIELGYKSYWKVLNAKNFDLAQNRERVMMISILNTCSQKFIMPDIIPSTKVILDIKQPEEDVDNKHYIEPKTYKHMIDIIKLDNGMLDNIKRKNRQISKIGIVSRSAFISSKIVIDVCGISPTLMARHSHKDYPKLLIKSKKIVQVLDDIKIRSLTPIECWRLMGYSDDDYYKAKDIGKLPFIKLYERAGRGIAVPMLEEIFKNLLIKENNIKSLF